MKRISLVVMLATLLFYSCKKNDVIDIAPVDYKVSLSYGANDEYSLPLANIQVVLKNVNTGNQVTGTSGNDGVVDFKGIAPGVYDIDAKVSISKADYESITGEIVTSDVLYNAASKQTVITSEANQELELILYTGTVSDWVIKQIYYAGSDRVEGALYRDQFVEIYNNSDQILYADSLFFGIVHGRRTSTTQHLLANGQFDWSMSLNMPGNIDANKDYCYVKTLIMIPGHGKQYPVQPGSSIVIAQTAVNHKSPFTGTDGTTISVRNPDLTIDLSNAEFEVYYKDILAENGSRALDSDIDAPAVNVDILSMFGLDFILDNVGRDGYIIFKAPGENVKNWPMYNEPLKNAPSANATKYYQIPLKYSLDYVEVQPSAATSRIPKKLGASYDAGYTFAPKGAYTSQSVVRKTAKIEGGRRILQDTNNSTEDFTFFDIATPKGFKD